MDLSFLPQVIQAVDIFFTNHPVFSTFLMILIAFIVYNYSDKISFKFLNKLKKEVDPKDIKPLHWECPKQIDAINFIKFSEDIRNKQHLVKYKETIQQQMNLVEQTLIEFISIEDKIFIKKLKEKIDNPDQIEREIFKYKLIIKQINTILKDKIRCYVKENHLAEKSEQDFYNYKRTKFLTLLETIKDYVDMFYEDRYFSLTLAEILILHDNNNSMFSNCFDNMFNQLRVISKGFNKKIEEMEKKLIDRLNSSFDIKYF